MRAAAGKLARRGYERCSRRPRNRYRQRRSDGYCRSCVGWRPRRRSMAAETRGPRHRPRAYWHHGDALADRRDWLAVRSPATRRKSLAVTGSDPNARDQKGTPRFRPSFRHQCGVRTRNSVRRRRRWARPGSLVIIRLKKESGVISPPEDVDGRVFARALAGRPAQILGNPTFPLP